MKRMNQLHIVFAALLIAVSTSLLFAAEPIKPVKASNTYSYNDYTVFSEEKYDHIESNMLIGIKADNTGLQTSCAYFLGEMKSDRAMIPLLKLVTKGKTEEIRIVAALSLYKIHSKIGMYRLKQLVKSENSELVKSVFKRIYNLYRFDGYSFR